MMTRRHFVGLIAKGILHGGAARLLWADAARAQFPIDGAVHYAPLNGRSLKELALKKRHHGKDCFLNFLGVPRSGRYWDLLRWKLSGNAFSKDLDAQPVQPVDIDWPSILNHNGLSITFLKHAGVMIKDGEHVYYVDPVFDSIGFFLKDYTPRRFDLDGIPTPSHVLITHGHFDHLDTRSLSVFPKETPVISPLGYDAVFEDLGMKNRSRLDWYGTFDSGRLRVTLLPCNHWTMRNPLEGPNRSLWGSFIIETKDGFTIYVAGDSAYFDGFEQIGDQYSIDLAIFNLGAYEPRWFMAKSHLDPAETVRAFTELKARRMMIVHWGTFRLGDEPVHFPPDHIKKALRDAGLQDRFIDIRHGGTYFIS